MTTDPDTQAPAVDVPTENVPAVNAESNGTPVYDPTTEDSVPGTLELFSKEPKDNKSKPLPPIVDQKGKHDKHKSTQPHDSTPSLQGPVINITNPGTTHIETEQPVEIIPVYAIPISESDENGNTEQYNANA
ncbi:hypothetical protein FBU30_011331 [Linnemannia zychae]|nr:hypothetical protein FBU30_011331 [Linnemannia zychae]